MFSAVSFHAQGFWFTLAGPPLPSGGAGRRAPRGCGPPAPPHPTGAGRFRHTGPCVARAANGRGGWKCIEIGTKSKGKDQTKGQSHCLEGRDALGPTATCRPQPGLGSDGREPAAPVRGPCSQIPPPSPSSRPPRVAVRAPGDPGAAAAPARRGWRGRQSGRALRAAERGG